jgi:putative nucleotidyltransferase with HDIG domain
MAIAPGQAPPKKTALLSIPAFPPIAIRLLQVIADENVALGEVIDLLRADPAFSAEMLRRANSALFGMASQVNTLQQALLVLGLRRVRALTMTVASGMYLNAALKIEELRRCWRHTLACALLTEELAHACGVHQDLAYTAGLMHDIGRLGLLVAHPSDYASFLRSATRMAASGDSFDLLDYEHQTFGVDHCAAGQVLAQEWNLPLELHVVIGRHHDRPMGGAVDLLTLAHLGCRLTDSLGFNVVEGQQCTSFAEIREGLPAAAQHRFQSDSAELRELIRLKIENLDIENAEPPVACRGNSDPNGHTLLGAGAPSPAPAPEERDSRSTLMRDIVVAALASIAAATVFFLVVRWLTL